MRVIEVVPHNPGWADAFARAAGPLAAALGANLLAIHHVGSTAIPGIYSKPVIDMLGVVVDIAAVELSNSTFAAIGYQPMGEFGIAGRRYFRRDGAGGVRTEQLHVFQAASPHVARYIEFRDFMRAHPDLALQYSELKRALATAHRHEMGAYMGGKDGFIKEMEARAVAWVATR